MINDFRNLLIVLIIGLMSASSFAGDSQTNALWQLRLTLSSKIGWQSFLKVEKIPLSRTPMAIQKLNAEIVKESKVAEPLTIRRVVTARQTFLIVYVNHENQTTYENIYIYSKGGILLEVGGIAPKSGKAFFISDLNREWALQKPVPKTNLKFVQRNGEYFISEIQEGAASNCSQVMDFRIHDSDVAQK